MKLTQELLVGNDIPITDQDCRTTAITNEADQGAGDAANAINKRYRLS
jgi:hypothetical protein